MGDSIYITTDKTKMDIAYIHKYLSERSYWAKGRSMKKVKKSIDNSLCFGVFNTKEKQIGFARIATDYVVFAWLMDVFVDENYKGKGIRKRLMDFIVNYPELKVVNGIGLRTNDAHKLYGKFGFKQIPEPQTWMLKKNN